MTETTPDYVYEDMNETSEPAHEAPTHHEAPAVIFTQLYAPKGGQIVQFNLTCRANSAREAIDQIIDGINYAKTKGFSVIRPMGDAPAASPSMPVERPASPVSAPAGDKLPPAPSAASNSPATGKTIHAVRMDVQPKPDGKVTLEWYADGHKFADIYTTRSIESAINLLSQTGAWTAEHLEKAQSFKVNHIITWRDSEKLNTRGNPYKDLVSIVAG